MAHTAAERVRASARETVVVAQMAVGLEAAALRGVVRMRAAAAETAAVAQAVVAWERAAARETAMVAQMAATPRELRLSRPPRSNRPTTGGTRRTREGTRRQQPCGTRPPRSSRPRAQGRLFAPRTRNCPPGYAGRHVCSLERGRRTQLPHKARKAWPRRFRSRKSGRMACRLHCTRGRPPPRSRGRTRTFR